MGVANKALDHPDLEPLWGRILLIVSKCLWTAFLALWWGFTVPVTSGGVADRADQVANLINPAELSPLAERCTGDTSANDPQEQSHGLEYVHTRNAADAKSSDSRQKAPADSRTDGQMSPPASTASAGRLFAESFG